MSVDRIRRARLAGASCSVESVGLSGGLFRGGVLGAYRSRPLALRGPSGMSGDPKLEVAQPLPGER